MYERALITGASSGLGRGLARHFANAGTVVYAAARRVPELEALKAECPAGKIFPVALDVSNADDTFARIQKLDQEAGGFDLVIANAGVGSGASGKKRVEWPHIKRLIDVNVAGATATFYGALEGMLARNKGHLVGVASIASYLPLPRSGAYSGSKAFMAVFLESLRLDLRETGIFVTCLHPGFVETEMTAGAKFKLPFKLELEPAVKLMASAIVRREASYAFPWQTGTFARAVSSLPRPLVSAISARLR